MDSLYDYAMQVLLAGDEVKMQFYKGYRWKQVKKRRAFILYLLFFKIPAIQSVPKAQKESNLPEYFHGPWGRIVANLGESRVSTMEETTAGSMEIVSDFPWL